MSLGSVGTKMLLAASAAVVATFSVPAASMPAQVTPELDARIEIVWPHDLAGNAVPVSQADRANASVYLFERGTLNSFCDTGSGVFLNVADNNQLPRNVPGAGAPRSVKRGTLTFPAWDFNDVDVSLARDPRHRLYFLVRDFVILPTAKVSTPISVSTNVWAHGADALTVSPTQDLPSSVAPAPPPGQLPLLDPKIEIVWPHDRQGNLTSVAQADRANVGIAIFLHATQTSVSPDYDRPVQLYRGLNQEPLRPVALGQKRIVTNNGLAYPVWDFNDVDVSAAKEPANKYFFQVKATGSEGSNIWAHGADGRTSFPAIDVPEKGCP